MKKSFLYLGVMAMLAVVFSSCLGDNESTMSDSGVFTLVQRDATGTLYAPVLIATGSVAKVTGAGLSEASEGDAVLVSYKINLDKWANSSMLAADYITVNKAFPRPYSSVGAAMDNTIENNLAFKSMGIVAIDRYDYMKNMWLFNVSAEVQGEDQKIKAVFSYNGDAAYQKTLDGKDLPANTVIVDVVLVKTGEVDPAASKTTKVEDVVVDFTSFRRAQAPATIDKEGIFVNIWFRYITLNGTEKVVKDLNINGVGLFYYPES